MQRHATSAGPELVPHFDVTTIDGLRVRYADLWQRRRLLLITATTADRIGVESYRLQWLGLQRELDECETALVMTVEEVAGIPPGTVLIADRWGEVFCREVAPDGDVTRLPSVDEVMSWVRFAAMQCPECPP